MATHVLIHGAGDVGWHWHLVEPELRWPDVPVRFVLARDDRMFPAEWLRGVVQDRLGFVPDEIDGGHCPALARPIGVRRRESVT